MSNYFSFPPDIMRNFVKMKCKFFYFSNGKYRKEKLRDVRNSLDKVKIYQGFIKQENRKTEVYITFIHLV